MSKPLLIAFIGFPGSGKTYFSTRLAKRLPAVTLNSDALRLAMFESLERIEEIRATDKPRLYTDVFGAMDYATRQALQSGVSVIYDAQMAKRRDRRNIEKLAAETGAIPVLVWMKTGRDEAIKRGQEREIRDDSHRYSEEKITMLVDRFASTTDLPEPGENSVEISGEVPFDEQFESFTQQLRTFGDS